MDNKKNNSEVPSTNSGSNYGSSLNYESGNQENFFARLKHIRNKLDISQDVLAKKIGVSTNTIQSWEKSTYPKGSDLILLADALDCSIDWLLRGETTIAPHLDQEVSEPEAKYKPSNIIEVEHSDIIKKFKDKGLAKEINQDLLDLECINKDAFEKMGTYIKGVVEGLKLAAGSWGQRDSDRRKSKRRQVDEPEKIPDGADRRNGSDRRRTGT